MSPSEWRGHFERLVAAFPALIRAARDLESPNPEDDEFVRLGAVGFQEAMPLSEWQRHHCQVIQDLRAGAYADEELEWYEEGAHAVASFACLWYGFLMGLNESGQLTEADRELGQALLPGFMLSALEQVTRGG